MFIFLGGKNIHELNVQPKILEKEDKIKINEGRRKQIIHLNAENNKARISRYRVISQY